MNPIGSIPTEPLPTVANDSAVPPSGTLRRNWIPLFDIRLTEREVAVLIDLPGIDEDELGIDILPDSFQVRGERAFDHDQEDAEDYVSLGRPYGPFLVNSPFPKPVDPNGATAKYRRGVLRLKAPLATGPYSGRQVQP